MIILIFFIVHWYVSLFCQTFFHHRYSAHAMYTMSRSLERYFYVLSWISMGSSYISPRAYAIMHRMHHAHADTPLDPHSPSYDGNIFKMMWKTRKIYSDIHYQKIPVEKKYKKDLPNWPVFDVIAHSWISRLVWAGVYISFYCIFAMHWWEFLLIPFTLVMGPLHGAIINWIAHKYGYRNFKVENTSRNLMPFDVLTMGEGYHNNHHAFPSRPNFAMRWFETDVTGRIIQLCNWLKIIQLRRS